MNPTTGFSAVLLATIIMIITGACSSKRNIEFPTTDLSTAPLIPKPLSMVATNSGFPLDQYTSIEVDDSNPELSSVANYLADKIKGKTGLTIPVGPVSQTETRIAIQLDQLASANKEAYELQITGEAIFLKANTPEGAFRGVQTIRQLIPEMADNSLADNEIWVVPTGEIKDAPQFGFRGTMLDVARHFFDAEYVKEYIDLIAYYKINVFHLHLTDDQGWRIEIKSWPKLAEVGGSTAVDGDPGGYYTQEQYQDIVAYAAERYITIVPEIDMPGHTNAASVAYPFLNGNGKPLALYEGKEVGFSTWDTRQDTVYAFIDDVIRELAAITPGDYIHIGGDESHSTKKEDFLYFINRVGGIVQQHGKRLIGWDEVANAELDPSAVVQIWHSEENGNKAIEKNMKIILSPADLAYLDMKYDSLTEIGYTWAGLIPVDKGYQWNPEDTYPMESVLGVEAPLWSETFADTDGLEYLAFPRLPGYAELGWSTKENRNWEVYKKRLAEQTGFFKRMDINYYPSDLIDWK